KPCNSLAQMLHDHTGCNRVVSRIVNHDETPGGAIAAVTVDDQRLLYFDTHPGNVVHLEPRYSVNALQSIYINPVLDLRDKRFGRLGGMLDSVFPPHIEGLLAEPTNIGFKLLSHGHVIAAFDDHVTAGNIDVILKQQSHRLGRRAMHQQSIKGEDLSNAGRPS